MLKRRAAWLAAASAMAALPLAARAGNIFWNVNGPGNWNIGGNWSPATIPGSADDAYVNEGTPTIGAAGADVSAIAVGDQFNALGEVIQTAGLVTINSFLGVGDTAFGTGTYFLEGGEIYFSGSTNLGMTVGGGGTTTTDLFYQTGGTLQQGVDQRVEIEQSGDYQINAGDLEADNIQIEEGGLFNQQGGTVNTPGALIIAPLGFPANETGSAEINGGSFTCPAVYVGGSSSAAGGGGILEVDVAGVLNNAGLLEVYNTAGTQLQLQPGGVINTGTIDFSGNPANFNWTGGKLHLTGQPLDFTTGTDPYTANPLGATLTLGSGQTLLVDTYKYSWEWLSGSGASVTQNTGSSNTCNSLYVGSTGTAATYTLNGGAFSSNGQSEFIGYIGTGGVGGTGIFNQSGGTNTTNQLLVANTAPGSYSLSGGSLSATTIVVDPGGSFHQSAGTMSFGTFDEFGGTVNLDLGLYVSASTYNLSGGSLTTSAIVNGGNISNFSFTGGSLTLTNQPVDLTNGTDPSYGGIVFGNSLTLNSGMSLTVAAPAGWWEYLYGSGSSITQNAGSSNTTPALFIGNTSGSGPADTYTMTGGTLSVGTGYIGYEGTYMGGTGLGSITQSAGNATFGALNIGYNAQGSYGLSGTGTLAVTGAENVGVGNYIGSLTISAGVNTAGNVAVGTSGGITMHGGTLTTSSTLNQHSIFQDGGTSSLGALSGSGLISLGGGASLASMTVKQFAQGTIDIASLGLFSVAPNSNFDNTVSTLSIVGSGQLDLANNHIFITYGAGPDPIASVAAWIKSGYAAGAWNGSGIMSTAAQSNSGSYGIGFADSADPGNPAGLSTGTIEIKYTLLGDANLDGKVNGADFAILATNFNKAVTGVSGWDQGDFNYDGKINGADFAFLAGNFNKGATQSAAGASDETAFLQFAQANGLTADVPEPATAAIIGLAGVGILRRWRRSSR